MQKAHCRESSIKDEIERFWFDLWSKRTTCIMVSTLEPEYCERTISENYIKDCNTFGKSCLK